MILLNGDYNKNYLGDFDNDNMSLDDLSCRKSSVHFNYHRDYIVRKFDPKFDPSKKSYNPPIKYCTKLENNIHIRYIIFNDNSEPLVLGDLSENKKEKHL